MPDGTVMPGATHKKSPLGDVNTKLADRVYTEERVNADLKKKGLHTEGNLRGTTNTSTGTSNADINNAMIDFNA